MSNVCDQCGTTFYRFSPMSGLDLNALQEGRMRVGCRKCGSAICFKCAFEAAQLKGKHEQCICPVCGAKLGWDRSLQLSGWD